MMWAARLIACVAVWAVAFPPALHAQMMQGNGMGGGRHGMINLVSPADSPIQIRRGAIMIGQYMAGMMGQNSIGNRQPGASGTGTPGIRIVLRLSGATDVNGLVTSGSNHLIFEGQVTTATGNRTPIAIDQPFALNAGSALVQVPVSLSAVTGPATITIDRIAVQDADDNIFAVPGVALAQPTPQTIPRPTPGGRCTKDSDCNDGDSTTQDVCMPMGCQHMHGHMGPGMAAPEGSGQ